VRLNTVMDNPTFPQRSAKAPITATKAHALLQGEFKRTKDPACRKCQAPVPYCGPGIGNHVMWYLPMLPACPHGCQLLLAALWVRFGTEYSITPPAALHGFFVKAPRKSAQSA